MISAKILADSVNPQGDRLTTMEIVLPRIILAEAKTHRIISGLGEQVEVTQSLGLNDEFDFSRNSASSRAIPFNKMVKMVEENPFIPIAWQKEHKGMQGTEYITNEDYVWLAKVNWLRARDYAVDYAKHSNEQVGVTKQLCNRLLEPFMYHKVIVTATEWENFFKLRCPQYHTPVSGEGFYFRSKKDCIANHSNSKNLSKLENMTDLEWLQLNKSQADIHIQAVAECMWDAMSESTPKKLQPGEYHLPFGDNISSDVTLYSKDPKVQAELWGKDLTDLQIKIAVARCARISYETLGDNPKIDYEADIRLHDILVESGHASPTEHVARCMTDEEYVRNIKGQLWDDKFEVPVPKPEAEGWSRNFRGFIQYRELINL